MLLYKYSLRFDYSCDVVKDRMINELVCVGRESLNGRMLTGKGYTSLCQGRAPCTLIALIVSKYIRITGKSQVLRYSYIIALSVLHGIILYLLWSNIGRSAMSSLSLG